MVGKGSEAKGVGDESGVTPDLSVITSPQPSPTTVFPQDALFDKELETVEENKQQRKARAAGERADHLEELLVEELQYSRDQFHADCRQHEQTIENKTSQILSLKDELRAAHTELARVNQSHRSLRFSVGIAGLAFGVGGSLISHFAGNAVSQHWAYLGWGVVLVGGVMQLIKTLFDA